MTRQRPFEPWMRRNLSSRIDVPQRRVTVLLIVLACPITAEAQKEDADPLRFADAMAKFADQDATQLPQPGGILIVGSSSVRKMKSEEVLPGVKLTNRGFGGAHISDVNYYLDQTVLKYRPSTVVFFCGNNDLWWGHSVEKVREEFLLFKGRLFAALPKTKLIVLALRPSPKRIRIIDTELAMNATLERLAGSDDRMTFLRGSCDRFLDDKGQPIPSLYAEDQLHMNAEGYQIWSDILLPLLQPTADVRP